MSYEGYVPISPYLAAHLSNLGVHIVRETQTICFIYGEAYDALYAWWTLCVVATAHYAAFSGFDHWLQRAGANAPLNKHGEPMNLTEYIKEFVVPLSYPPWLKKEGAERKPHARRRPKPA